jgi:hypothetical protein
MACGIMILGTSAGPLATSWAPGPGWLWFVLSNAVVAVALLLWGWSRLHRAKAARPDLSWWQFLRIELIAVAILLVWVPIFAAMSPEQRNSLLNNLFFALLALADLIRMAKGQA